MSGLPKANGQRYHFDIYAILEGTQELYFGHEVMINVNMVETVKLVLPNGEGLEKCYFSPTKRRGIERRSLLWAPCPNGQMLGENLDCHIPRTCAKPECPICSVYGGLIVGKQTLIGRLTHAGGVAIQRLLPEEKQRAMHPTAIVNDPNENPPQPFKRQYNEPGLLYPVYNHCLSVTEQEFTAVAYAFLDSLARIGSGNPKGATIYETDGEPLLVVDKYLVPHGERPVISPAETSVENAIRRFQSRAWAVNGGNWDGGSATTDNGNFQRWVGKMAYQKLQDWADTFVNDVLKKYR
ncbi:MAG: hypothetical protein KatS3mg131_3375 [Candidatus Tectimicrobiota bacterium]|nr:MAG: hypothetical protein KatS3mg131_3375 [Candidatus Tectomicrobia bacterium]